MARSLKCVIFTVCLACSFTIDGSVNGLDSALKEKAEQALLGFDDMIMRLNSGECHITGKTKGGTFNIEDDIAIAFDYSKNCYRFSNGSLKWALLTPDHFYEVWHPDKPGIASVTRSSASDYKPTSAHCHVIDVQDIFRYIPVGPSKPFDYQESDFHRNIRETEVTDYEELPSGLIKIATAEGEGENQLIREYYIDPKRGYTIPHWELKVVGIPYYLYQVRDISWKKVNKTWVPTAYNLKGYVSEKETDKPRTTVDWKIEWKKVNEKIEPALFDVDEMLSDLKYGVTLTTTELGPEEVSLGWIAPDGSLKERHAQREKLSWFRIVFLSVGIIFIAAGLWRKILISRRAKEDAAPENDLPVS
ncbi:MAG: hypothetical protein IKE69_06970 [Thermoguttaceae bacterium]|nr:hypothetical protein [Thermoguttaceae bacterium]